jgi:hypothetical protein
VFGDMRYTRSLVASSMLAICAVPK